MTKTFGSTRQALEGSIDKWWRIAWAGGEDRGPNNCPLCVIYYDRYCDGCPVSRVTGMGACSGTPYEGFEGHTAKQEHRTVRDERAREYALAELDFLRGLRPLADELDRTRLQPDEEAFV